MSRRRKRFVIPAIVLIGMTAFIWVASVFLTVQTYASLYPIQSMNPKTKGGEVTFHRSKPAEWVDIAHVSKDSRMAIMISEDSRFFTHDGFDFAELQKALKKNMKEGEYARGASTITQQVAKNLFLTKKKSLVRKIKEVFYTLALELLYPKQKIFEIYLNIAEWGPNLYGIKKASLYYFQKAPSKLNAKEGAFLAVLLPSPGRNAASFHKKQLTAYAERRIKSILKNMVLGGYLSQSEAIYLDHFPLPFETVPEIEFFDEVILEDSIPEPSPSPEETVPPEEIDPEPTPPIEGKVFSDDESESFVP